MASIWAGSEIWLSPFSSTIAFGDPPLTSRIGQQIFSDLVTNSARFDELNHLGQHLRFKGQVLNGQLFRIEISGNILGLIQLAASLGSAPVPTVASKYSVIERSSARTRRHR